MPDEVVDVFGYALYLAQIGRKHEQAKPLKGFGSAGVLEIVEDLQGGTYRAVYTVRVCSRCVCAACVSEEVEARHLHAKGRPGLDSDTLRAVEQAAKELEL